MPTFAVRLAVAVLLGAAISLIIVGVLGNVPSWVLFLMHVSTIVSCGIAIRAVKQRQVHSFVSDVPGWARLALPIVAAAGIGLFVSLPVSMPRLSPNGNAVHTYGANAYSGKCRAIYNSSEEVVEPMEVCLAFERRGSLAFIGAWLLFGSIALWLAVLAVKTEGNRTHAG